MFDHVRIFDTTLRDGEQTPGVAFSAKEKVTIARLLEELEVDVIEAGFPANSAEDSYAVRSVSEECTRTVVCALARAVEKDIDAALEALAPAVHPRLHTFIATSPMHMEHKLRLTPNDVLARITHSVTRARTHVHDVEWSAEDASQSDLSFLSECVLAAIEAGATTINLPDTCGFATPEEYGRMFTHVMHSTRKYEGITYSAHCHNDLGLATANSLAAIATGARQIECTVLGLGERTGNASLEEVVMALRTKRAQYKADTRVESRRLTCTSHTVGAIARVPVPPSRPVVGTHAFAHASGIHQDGTIKHARMYEVLCAEDVGQVSTLRLGKLSGSAAYEAALIRLGFPKPTSVSLEKLMSDARELSIAKQIITDDLLRALYMRHTGKKKK